MTGPTRRAAQRVPAAAPALPVSARLAAWGGRWLAGGGSGDDVLAAVRGPREVVGLPDTPPDGAVGLVVALAALRRFGATGLRLALPVPGDPLGLPGPRALTEAAVASGEAVVAVDAPWALVLEDAGPDGPPPVWRALAAEDRPVDVPSVAEAERLLSEAVLLAASDLAALDVGGASRETLAALGDLRPARDPLLPAGCPTRAEHLAGRASRLLAVVRLARGDDGSAVSATQLARRTAALCPLDSAARRALVAAVAAPSEPR